MKKKIRLFIWLSVALLLVLPLVNILFLEDGPRPEPFRKKLYKTDLMVPAVADVMRHYGISVLPKQALIGKDGWMFLSDYYAGTISHHRYPVTKKDEKAIAHIVTSIDQWDAWFKTQGVKGFHIVMGPDKKSIHPEFMPDWFSHPDVTKTDALMAKVGKQYIDPRDVLLDAKVHSGFPVYRKHDSHWNSYGGWLAFNEYMKALRTTGPLKTLNEKDVVLGPVTQIRAGGTANFFGLADKLHDEGVPVAFRSMPPVRVEHYDYGKNKFLRAGMSDEEIAKPYRPTLTVSPNALNKKRVLWLRDSFGDQMGPYMSRTFTEVLQMTYLRTPPKELIRFVQEFKPDYILVTNVERQAMGRFFQAKLPDEVVRASAAKEGQR